MCFKFLGDLLYWQENKNKNDIFSSSARCIFGQIKRAFKKYKEWVIMIYLVN